MFSQVNIFIFFFDWTKNTHTACLAAPCNDIGTEIWNYFDKHTHITRNSEVKLHIYNSLETNYDF